MPSASTVVTGSVVGLGSGFFDQLGAHVLPGVLQLDLFGDGDTVFRDGGSAVAFGDECVAAVGAHSHADCIGKFADAFDDLLTCFVSEEQVFS
jgi:hypothetical protein